MELTSPEFRNGDRLPKKYTGEGVNVSPPLHWQGVPEATRQFAIVCTDQDGPGGMHWVHWLLYNVPAGCRTLPEGLIWSDNLDDSNGIRQGKNSWDVGKTIGYRGPLPHSGTGVHRYLFSLYALDMQLNLSEGLEKNSLLSAIEGHVLERADLIGTYER